jgi:hypothetical protein
MAYDDTWKQTIDILENWCSTIYVDFFFSFWYLDSQMSKRNHFYNLISLVHDEVLK